MRIRTELFTTFMMLMAFDSTLPAVDMLYVSMNNNTIVSYDTTGNDGMTIAATMTTFASTNLSAPRGLAFDTSGNLYAANYGNSSISKFNSSGGYISNIASNLSNSSGLAFDSLGNLYVSTGWGNDKILKITPDGSVTSFATGLNYPFGIAFGSDGFLYCATMLDHSIVKIASNGLVTNFVTNIGGNDFGYGIWDLVFDKKGYLYADTYGGSESGVISRIAPDGTVSNFVSSRSPEDIYGYGNGLMGMAIDNDGYIYVANGSGFAISKISPTGDIVCNFSTGGVYPRYLTFAPSVTNVPEPSTYALSTIAAGVIAYLRLKRRTIGLTTSISFTRTLTMNTYCLLRFSSFDMKNSNKFNTRIDSNVFKSIKENWLYPFGANNNNETLFRSFLYGCLFLLPTVIPTGNLSAIDAYLFWSNDGGPIKRSLLDGSQVTTVVNMGADGIYIDSANQYLYWGSPGGFNSYTGRIYRSNLDGGNIQLLVDNLNRPQDLFVFDNKLYFSDFWDAKIYKSNLDGSNRQLILQGIYDNPGNDAAYCIAVDTSTGKLIYGDGLGSQQIGKFSLDGTNLQRNYIPGLAIDMVVDQTRGYLYYANNRDAIFQSRLDGTGNSTLVGGLTQALGLAFDPVLNDLYFTEHHIDSKKVKKYNLDTGQVSTIYTSDSSVPYYISIYRPVIGVPEASAWILASLGCAAILLLKWRNCFLQVAARVTSISGEQTQIKH